MPSLNPSTRINEGDPMPIDQKVTRKLRAILSADVKGYSLLMADDEVFTIETLKTYRQIMSECIENRAGRVVDSPGDNILADFASAVDAVRCAVEIQNKLKNENKLYKKDNRVRFRIGINLGDVVHDEGRIYGSGVNIASRIEGLADPGGICISRNIYDQVKDKLELNFDYLGENEVKNIKEPVRVYKVLIGNEQSEPLVKESLELPDKPSIAVLPFNNMSGDPSQEYFSDGLTEQIISGLCKISKLFVIARNSSFAYKDKSISIKQISQELGVKYILEGSVQRSGDRVRITAQLIDAKTDYHMWSETYDRELVDIFALQDEITMKLMNAMHVKLTDREQSIPYGNELKNIKAVDKYMRGMECFFRVNRQNNAQAHNLFTQASKLDNRSAMLFALIGWTHLYDFVYSWGESPSISFEKTEIFSKKALSLNDSLYVAHLLMGWIHMYKKEYDKAIEEAKKAVALNPNGADSHAHLGFMLCMAGEIEKAIRNLKKAFRLNPIPPPYYYHFLGSAYSYDKQYEIAIEILNQSINIDPEPITPYLSLTSTYIEIENLEQAKISAKKILEIDPSFSLEYHKNVIPYKDKTELDRYIGSLRKAGLPD